MKRWLNRLPLFVTALACLLLAGHGPIAQLAHYHEFADRSVLLGIPHAADVLSNIGFAAIAVWGLLRLWSAREDSAIKAAWPGYFLFLIGLLLTAFGSSFYHLAPDNARLVWDRLPIALACAGLLAAVRAENVFKADAKIDAVLLAVFAMFSVAWWYVTDRSGNGDLRPYLLLQGLPLMLIPLWQWIHGAPRADCSAFGAALLLYVFAKAAELNDYQLQSLLVVVSGHTLKHLLATAAAYAIVVRLVRRVEDAALPKKVWGLAEMTF